MGKCVREIGLAGGERASGRAATRRVTLSTGIEAQSSVGASARRRKPVAWVGPAQAGRSWTPNLMAATVCVSVGHAIMHGPYLPYHSHGTKALLELERAGAGHGTLPDFPHALEVGSPRCGLARRAGIT